MRKSVELLVISAGVFIYCAGLLVFTGLIPEWGRWYSASPAFSSQVEAFLSGRLSLGGSPLLLMHDLAWSEGGVHQLWGLGVPLWRLVFAAAARACGFEGFPDILAFGCAMGLAVGLAVHACITLSATVAGPERTIRRWMVFSGAILILTLSPPFISLLQSRFLVYEEVVAYEYLFGLVLLCGLAALADTPRRKSFYWLCLLSGFGGMLRPTLLLYGLATVVSGWLALILGQPSLPGMSAGKTPGGFRAKSLLAGCCLFGAGNILMFFTNYYRFGSGFEFGHQLSMTANAFLYFSRFDYPFQQEPFWSAARELFAVLFLQPNFNHDFFQSHFFSGQSETMRWREMYFTTYDLTYFILLLGGLTSGLAAGVKLTKTDAKDVAANLKSARIIVTLALWGGISAILLFWFYLRTLIITSRYLLDFLPAFAAVLIAVWLGICSLSLKSAYSRFLMPPAIVILGSWLAWQFGQIHNAHAAPHIVAWEDMRVEKERIAALATGQPVVPVEYDNPLDYLDTGIPYNGAGMLDYAYVMPAMTIFVQDPGFLELELTSRDAELADGAIQHVRAKIGREFLERESVTKTPLAWTIRFRGPTTRRYQHGIQSVFIAFVPNSEAAAGTTMWRLLKVRWRRPPEIG